MQNSFGKIKFSYTEIYPLNRFYSLSVKHISQPAGVHTTCSKDGDIAISTPSTNMGNKRQNFLVEASRE
jgi:hypothetical protein